MAEGTAESGEDVTVAELPRAVRLSTELKVFFRNGCLLRELCSREALRHFCDTKTKNQGKAAVEKWRAVCPDLRIGNFPLLAILGLKGWKAKGNSLADFQRSDSRTGKPILWSETLKCFVEARKETLLRKHLPAKHHMTKQEVLALAKTFSVEKPMKAQSDSEAYRAVGHVTRNLVHEAQVLVESVPVSGETIAHDSKSHSRIAQKLLVQNFASYGLSPQQIAKVMSPENHMLMTVWGSEASSSTMYRDIRQAADDITADLRKKLAEKPEAMVSLQVDDTSISHTMLNCTTVVLSCPSLLPEPIPCRVFLKVDHSDARAITEQILVVLYELDLNPARLAGIVCDNATVNVRAIKDLQRLGSAISALPAGESCRREVECALGHRLDGLTKEAAAALGRIQCQEEVRRRDAAGLGDDYFDLSTPVAATPSRDPGPEVEIVDPVTNLTRREIEEAASTDFMRVRDDSVPHKKLDESKATFCRRVLCEWLDSSSVRKGMASLALLPRVPCMAHSAALAVGEVFDEFEWGVEVCQRVKDLFAGQNPAPHRESAKAASAYSSDYLFAPTRWGSVWKAAKAILIKRKALIAWLSAQSRSGSGSNTTVFENKAERALNNLRRFDTMLQLAAMVEVARPLVSMIEKLQSHMGHEGGTEMFAFVENKLREIRQGQRQPTLSAEVLIVGADRAGRAKCLAELDGSFIRDSDSARRYLPAPQHARATAAKLRLQAADRGWRKLKEWGAVIAARWKLMDLLRPRPDAGLRFAHLEKSVPKYYTHAEPGKLPRSARFCVLVMNLCRGQINHGQELLHLLNNNVGTALQIEEEWRHFVAYCESHRELACLEIGSDGRKQAEPCKDLEAWWREKRRTWPLLSRIAQALYSTPVTSAGAERFFSVLTDWCAICKRTRAHTQLLGSQLLLLSNQQFVTRRIRDWLTPRFKVCNSSVDSVRQEQGQALVKGQDGLAGQLVSSRVAPAARACSLAGASAAPSRRAVGGKKRVRAGGAPPSGPKKAPRSGGGKQGTLDDVWRNRSGAEDSIPMQS